MGHTFILQEHLADVSICDDIITYYQDAGDKQVGMVMTKAGYSIDKAIKDSSEVMLTDGPVGRYIEALQEVVNKYIELYPQCNMYAPWGLTSPPNIQCYPPNGGYFSWHTERISAEHPVTSRHLVFMTYLNDVTDGGETEFAIQGVKVQPRKGLTLIWPADWTHTHRGLPSPTQTKYIVTGWFNFM